MGLIQAWSCPFVRPCPLFNFHPSTFNCFSRSPLSNFSPFSPSVLPHLPGGVSPYYSERIKTALSPATNALFRYHSRRMVLSYVTMHMPMKTPLIAIVAGCGLGLFSLVSGFRLPVYAYAAIIFGTGILAWTIEQYGGHRLP